MRLDGRVVVVTGGSRGLGKAMVCAFAEQGANVVIASRKVDNCVALADEVTDRFGVRALPVACNVGDWRSCDELVERTHHEFGKIDVLVNNAGLSPLYPSLDQVSEALFDKVVGVNLKGPFRLSALACAQMAQDGGGSVINISSLAAIRADGTSLPYAAAKAGLNALTEGLAQAYAPSVRVNAIQCGPFLTDVAAAWSPEVKKEASQRVALGRCGEANDIVGAALFFATPASTYCTGTILRLDGGAR
ncbi:short-chain dehydrogenase [Mycolicibacterium mucogenicum]|uniref:Short-chain dehydrogenase n=1 Tax=Mycolicibacterium mucogenicum TaxID=56689 RepID=A0A1A3HFP5_MYCMU|nr:SDR family oxidoreductase [Mycolicibacterium mucogenicum]OBJ46443.1 short-chain dehydrogenase [Mycolicibacterium mucogenicum]